jgi:uncharacterized membrane protein
LILLALFSLFVCFTCGLRWFDRRKGRLGVSKVTRELLDLRYSTGEITRAQYEQMKRYIT